MDKETVDRVSLDASMFAVAHTQLQDVYLCMVEIGIKLAQAEHLGLFLSLQHCVGKTHVPFSLCLTSKALREKSMSRWR